MHRWCLAAACAVAFSIVAAPAATAKQRAVDKLDALLAQAEYRYEIWSGFDAALFYDAGKVAESRQNLDFTRLERDYGILTRPGLHCAPLIHAAFRRSSLILRLLSRRWSDGFVAQDGSLISQASLERRLRRSGQVPDSSAGAERRLYMYFFGRITGTQ